LIPSEKAHLVCFLKDLDLSVTRIKDVLLNKCIQILIAERPRRRKRRKKEAEFDTRH
jgi:hypothetical protein